LGLSFAVPWRTSHQKALPERLVKERAIVGELEVLEGRASTGVGEDGGTREAVGALLEQSGQGQLGGDPSQHFLQGKTTSMETSWWVTEGPWPPLGSLETMAPAANASVVVAQTHMGCK